MKRVFSYRFVSLLGSVLFLAVAIVAFKPDLLWGKKAKTSSSIEVWERQAGDYSTSILVGKKNRKTLRVPLKNLKTRALFDIQYEAKHKYRGIYLKDLLKRYPKPPGTDLILLHFANNMVVPWLLRPDPVLAPKIFVAFAMKGKERTFQSQFRPISHKTDISMDARPIEFVANKLVVSKQSHPWLRDPTGELFSPFLHVDSLVGIEWVNQEAYYNQYRPGYVPEGEESNPEADRVANVDYSVARKIFRDNCQYCHSFRNVGATFGWDFVTPIPLQDHKSAQDLLGHVSHRSYNALERGLMMPTFGEFTMEEMEAFLVFAKDVSDSEMLWPYAPPNP